LSLLIIEVIALFLYSKSKNRTDENFSISPIYYRTNILICTVFYKSFFTETKNPSASGITVYFLALGF
ncbi:hypothetical protein, partial [Staphylococcus aureus]